MDKEKEKEEYGRELRENNIKIVNCIVELKAQRDELVFLIEKLKDEKNKLETEMERLTYKLCLVNKSTAQRMKAKQQYDDTIAEMEEKYNKIKESSGELVRLMGKDCEVLDSMLNKKTSTGGIEQYAEVKAPIVEEVKDEECMCLPNKDGKCIREKMLSKMVQATAEIEEPVKLEKEPDQVTQTESILSKGISEKGAQTLVTGEPDYAMEESDSAIVKQKSKLTRAATEYKEASMRPSF